ncbi:MAG: hypothetical protein H6706_21985 [Myxococcales bacterium]|nr:hypothetical protein [Myxococcales bacterium]
MKSILIALAALCVSTPVFAGKVVKDRSGAWSCQRSNGEVINYFWPAGRVPTSAEQVQCQQAGGAIKQPAPTKIDPVRDESPN